MYKQKMCEIEENTRERKNIHVLRIKWCALFCAFFPFLMRKYAFRFYRFMLFPLSSTKPLFISYPMGVFEQKLRKKWFIWSTKFIHTFLRHIISLFSVTHPFHWLWTKDFQNQKLLNRARLSLITNLALYNLKY